LTNSEINFNPVLHRIIYQRPLITISTMVAENSHTKLLA